MGEKGAWKQKRPGALTWPCAFLERVTGIEPALSAWKAGVLPLNYTREMKPEQYSATRGRCKKKTELRQAGLLGAGLFKTGDRA